MYRVCSYIVLGFDYLQYDTPNKSSWYIYSKTLMLWFILSSFFYVFTFQNFKQPELNLKLDVF